MKITAVETKLIPIQLNAPFKTALREVHAVEVIRVLLSFDNGIVGIGEAAPTEVITGDTKESILTDIETVFTPFLLGRKVDAQLLVMDELHALIQHHTSPKAAIDIALHDALAKAANLPLYRYLGGSANTLTTDYTISVGSQEQMLHDAQAKIQAGFRSLKIKLGVDAIEEEVAKIRRINERLAGKIPFRIDANQGWTKEEAVQILDQWQDIPIEFVEQPVKANDFAGLSYVTARTTIPIMADESLFSYEDAKRLIAENCCDYKNIKLMKSGGIKEGQKIYQLAKEHQMPVMVGSMIEGYGGMAAAAHFALGMADVQFYDLDVPFMWETQTTSPEMQGILQRPGSLSVTERIGLGINE